MTCIPISCGWAKMVRICGNRCIWCERVRIMDGVCRKAVIRFTPCGHEDPKQLHHPQPNIISVHLNPRSGKAAISTRIRLADTQTVTAIAEMSDGSFWQDTGDVIITLGACLEDPV